MKPGRFIGTFDGSCGPPALGGALRFAWTLKGPDGRTRIGKGSCPPRPQNTSNMAEYAGLLTLLRFLDTNGISRVHIYGDSKLIINMVNGRWGHNVKNPAHRRAPHLIPYLEECKKLLRKTQCTLDWVCREMNTLADQHTKRTAHALKVADNAQRYGRR